MTVNAEDRHPTVVVMRLVKVTVNIHPVMPREVGHSYTHTYIHTNTLTLIHTDTH